MQMRHLIIFLLSQDEEHWKISEIHDQEAAIQEIQGLIVRLYRARAEIRAKQSDYLNLSSASIRKIPEDR